jgi:hypothetical protein
MTFTFPPVRRSRNPLLRALSLIVGLAVVGVLMVFGVVVLAVLVVGGGALLAWRQWKMARGTVRPPAAVRGDVLEGEFVVLDRQHAAR